MSKSESYNLDPSFERAVVTLCSSRPRFYGRIGKELDPAAISEGPARLALEAARAIEKDGAAPSSALLVVQRLRRWMSDGRVTIEDVRAVADMFDAAEDAGLPTEDEVASELRPILQKRIRREVVTASMDEYGSSGDMGKVVELVHRAQRVGLIDTSIGVTLGPSSFAEFEKLRHLDRLPIGVMELDSYIDGGLPRKGLGVFLGGSGDGKSMALAHVAGTSILGGFFVAVATLELPEAMQLARIKAHVTGIPINALLQGSTDAARAQLAAMQLGPCIVKEFTPLSSTVEDLYEWLKDIESRVGRAVDVLVVDYADKLGAKSRSKGDESGYSQGRIVYEGLRIGAVERDIWCWTASQATRSKDKKRKLDLNDAADSMHKMRVADLVVTLNLQGDEDALEMVLGVAKNRTGKSRAAIGPLPCEFECARIAPVVLPELGFGVPRALALDTVSRLGKGGAF